MRQWLARQDHTTPRFKLAAEGLTFKQKIGSSLGEVHCDARSLLLRRGRTVANSPEKIRNRMRQVGESAPIEPFRFRSRVEQVVAGPTALRVDTVELEAGRKRKYLGKLLNCNR